ncbi:N-alpha-acetyltransferase 40 [Aphelenchoides bicaudatus]|nr:N-alpha-acetyltransferase 40 [Aphelenchoides bicaudatus]
MRFGYLLRATARVIKDTNATRFRAGSKSAIVMTPQAIERIKQLLSEQPQMTALKIGVKERGCNGLTYTLDYANKKERFDEEVVQDGAKVWIDMKAQLSILGSEMDYVESKLASEFVFRNPNIKGTCEHESQSIGDREEASQKGIETTQSRGSVKCVPEQLKLKNGEEANCEFFWATHLDDAQFEWVFELFAKNMEEFYRKSEWGYDEDLKKNELRATTARYIVVRNKDGKKLAFLHYRFVIEANEPVLYIYELQVEQDYQNQGIGSLLLDIVEKVAKKVGMVKTYATVFKFNTLSLEFFRNRGYENDENFLECEQENDYYVISKRTETVAT